VAFATKSLLSGLQKLDSLDILAQRLRELPPDLNDLYRHILAKVHPRYQQYSAIILRTLYRYIHSGNFEPMTLLHLSFTTDRVEAVLNARFYAFDIQEGLLRYRQIAQLIANSCYGLVEVNCLP